MWSSWNPAGWRLRQLSRRGLPVLLIGLGLTLFGLALGGLGPAQATDSAGVVPAQFPGFGIVVGNGTPASCTASAFDAAVRRSQQEPVIALDASRDQHAQQVVGGPVRFSCGGPMTIVLTGTAIISGSATIDGGGAITLSGDRARRLFLVNSTGSLTLRNIVLADGHSPNADGGAIHNSGRLTLRNTTVRGATAPASSGGAIATIGSLEIISSTLVNNGARNGGAIVAAGASARVTITQSALRHNQVDRSLTNNGRGGAIYVVSNATLGIIDSEVFSNTARYGGGVSNLSSTVAFTNVTLLENLGISQGGGTGHGGGVRNEDGTTTFVESRLISNTAEIGGGIDALGGTTTLTDVTLAGNRERLAGYSGGGINNYQGVLDLQNVTLSGNSAGGGGGGIGNAFGGVATLTNVTFSGNAAGNTGGRGGGLMNYRATATLVNVTLAGNAAPSGPGGGIWNEDHPDTHLHLRNVIVAASPAGGNCGFGKAPDSSVSNLSSDATCSFGASRDSVNAQLGPLMHNGGLTLTHLPQQSDSPAVNGGTGTGCPPEDQRGASRPIGTVCDVGAVELGAKPRPTALLPTTATAGGPTFVLTVTGLSFLPGATVLWNGDPRPTGYLRPQGSRVIGGALTATIPSSDIAVGGTASVSVRHGALAAETSDALAFTVNKRDQTISFDPILDHVFGDQPFAVVATASSGLPVSFAASGSCSVSGSTVNLTGGGTCTITAFQDGDATFNAAPNVGRTFAIAASGPTSTPTPTATPTPSGTPGVPSGATSTPGGSPVPTRTPGPGGPNASQIFVPIILSGFEAGW